MRLFLLIFTAVYTALHLIAFLRLKPIITARGPALKLVLAFGAVMLLMPLAVGLFSRLGLEGLANALAWPAYLWMGLVVLLFTASVASWPLQLVLAWINSSFLRLDWIQPARLMAWLVLIVSLTGLAYGYLEAGQITTEQVVMPTAKLPAGLKRLRLAVTSDLHLGRTSRLSNLEQVLKLVKRRKPDLWLDLGDMVDGPVDPKGPEVGLLASVDPPFGKYVVPGNHENYNRLDHALKVYRAAGFKPLLNRAQTVYGLLNLAGVSDLPKELRHLKTMETLNTVQNGLFTILMKHRPEVTPGSTGLMDLQLSGHTHRGQVWPFNYVVGLVHRYLDGMYPLADGAHILTSRGTGYWGPPIRLFSPPLVLFIDILPGSVAGENPEKPALPKG